MQFDLSNLPVSWECRGDNVAIRNDSFHFQTIMLYHIMYTKPHVLCTTAVATYVNSVKEKKKKASDVFKLFKFINTNYKRPSDE